jgi:hypothetical protein
LFASIYAEIFLTNKGQYFERVRFFGGLGYQFSNPFTLQVGWIRQFDYWAIIPALKKIFYKHLYSFGKTNIKVITRSIPVLWINLDLV